MVQIRQITKQQHKLGLTLQHLASLASAGLKATGTEQQLDEEERVKQIEEAHLAESLERLILEAYKLLQAGEMAQAESLLQEGKFPRLPKGPHQTGHTGFRTAQHVVQS